MTVERATNGRALTADDAAMEIATRMAIADPLTRAWAAVIAALPKDWTFEVVRRGNLNPDPNPKTGRPVQYVYRYEAAAWPTFADEEDDDIAVGDHTIVTVLADEEDDDIAVWDHTIVTVLWELEAQLKERHTA